MREEEKRLAEELLFSEKKQPSFVKQLFFGRFDAAQVFPFPEPSSEKLAETEQFLARVKAFAEEKIDGAKIDREKKIGDEVIQGLADLGVLGMTVPRECGGLGMSQYAYCRTTELLSRYCASTALYVNVHQSIGLKSLLLFGTEAQKHAWLPLLASGKETAAFSLTEPNAGSDANGIETRAVYDPVKRVYRLNGCKQWTTSGGIAKVLTVMAKMAVKGATGEEDKVTAFLVTSDMPGFLVKNPQLEKVGMRGTWTANLEFKDLEVPEENILGPVGKGLKVCLTVLDFGRTTFGSTCTGTAKMLVEKAYQHAKERYQFHRPLASFGLVKKKLALMSAFAYAMESTTYLTAGFIDRGLEDFMLEAAILKVFASDAQWQILFDTMQIYGGRSFFTDHPFERMMRDARLNMIGEGSNEVLRAFIGIVGIRDVGMALKTSYDSLKQLFSHPHILLENLKNFSGCLRGPEIPVKSPLLQKEAKMLSKIIVRFARAVIKLLMRHREELVEQQQQLDRLTNVVTAIYTCTAVLSRLDSALNRRTSELSALEKELRTGQFYCHQSLRMAGRFLQAIDRNQDAQMEGLADFLGGTT